MNIYTHMYTYTLTHTQSVVSNQSGQFVDGREVSLSLHLCVYNTKRHNSSHPITMASLMQCVMLVMAGALIHKESSLHLQQKVHTLLPPPAHTATHRVSDKKYTA